MDTGKFPGDDLLFTGEGGTLIQEQLIVPELKPKKEKVIVLSGPTSSGKTALGVLLAQVIGGEIVSADSVQVYRGMNIGTAKATAFERAQVPHHLLDIREVWQHFNVVDFYHEARFCIQRILARGEVPIITGGSGFYLHALLYGPPSGPPSVPEIRDRIQNEMDLKGADFMYEKLCQLDLDYAQTITCHDKQKIVRALEIMEISGNKVSHLRWKERRVPRDYDFRCWFLNRPKSILYDRIEQRCDKMIAQGLLQEVEGLIAQGIMENPSACQAIGYKQGLEFLEGNRSREEYLKFVQEFKKLSRRYAKRQLTWFRRESLFQWIDLDLHDPETIIDLIMRDWDSR